MQRVVAAYSFELEFLPVDRERRVQLDVAERLIDDSTLLVSVQAASNEIGTLQQVPEIARMAHVRGALVHCDAAQAVGKIPVDVETWGIDFLSLSGPSGKRLW